MPATRQELLSELTKAQAHVAELETLLYEDLPHASALLESEGYKRTLDTLREGCQIIGFDWRYLYLNDAAVRHGQRAKDELLGYTMMDRYPGIEKTEMFAVLQRCMQDRMVEHIENEFIYPDGTNAWFDLSVQPVPEGIFIFSLDITERKRAEAHIRTLNRTLSMLSGINQAIVRIHHLPTLFEKACGIAVETGAFHMAWIGLLDPKTKRINPVAQAGVSDSYLEKLRSPLGDEQGVQHPAVNALRAGERWVCNNLETDPQMLPWRDDALQQGYRASAAWPLRIAGKLGGVFNLFAVEPDFFNAEELSVLDEIAMDIAFTMTVAEQEAQRQAAETAVKRYAQRMEILHQIDRGLLDGGSIQVLVEVTLNHLRQLVPCQRADVMILDETTNEALTFAVAFDGNTTLGQGIRVPIPSNVFEGYDARHIRVFDDFRALQDIQPRARRLVNEGLLCALSAVLIDRDQPLGTLGLFANTPSYFTAEHQEIVAEIASQLSIAIKQLRLSEALARYTVDLEQRVIERTADLNDTKERVEAILNNSVDGILLLSSDLRIQQSNSVFNRLFACEPDDYFDRPLFDLIHKDGLDQVSGAIRTVIDEHTSKRIEFRAKRKNGTDFDAELGIGFITGDGYVCTIQDITERKTAEELLQKAFEKEKELNVFKSSFISMASHEFRTPLATILATTETLSAYRVRMTEEQIEQRFGKIRDQVDYLKNIMEDVLQLAQLQARRTDFKPISTNLHALCRTILDEFQSRPDITQQLLYTCDDPLREVPLDPKLMRQIISNLVSNAIKYSPPDKPITITLEYIGEALVFKVRDEGIGIPKTDLSHLFEAFHRASNVGGISGTGLGLVITKESVELHGGTITVDSQVGVGTTFTATIPVNAEGGNSE